MSYCFGKDVENMVLSHTHLAVDGNNVPTPRLFQLHSYKRAKSNWKYFFASSVLFARLASKKSERGF